MKIALSLLAIVALAGTSSGAVTSSLNFDTDASGYTRGAGPALDGGWEADQIDGAFVDSQRSSYDFTIGTAAYFRITDQFIVGDTYFIYDGAALIGTTSLNGAQPSILPIGDFSGDAGWTDGRYQHAEILLNPGTYSLRVQGDGVGGIPAGFYVRLDTVPTPGAAALMGVAGLAAFRRRR